MFGHMSPIPAKIRTQSCAFESFFSYSTSITTMFDSFVTEISVLGIQWDAIFDRSGDQFQEYS